MLHDVDAWVDELIVTVFDDRENCIIIWRNLKKMMKVNKNPYRQTTSSFF